MDSYTLIVGYFNTSPSIMDKTTRQKISKEIRLEQHTPNKFNRHIQNIQFNKRIHILPKHTWIFSRIDHIGPKTSLNRLKKLGIIY